VQGPYPAPVFKNYGLRERSHNTATSSQASGLTVYITWLKRKIEVGDHRQANKAVFKIPN
jgi:hypothetical protein